MFVFLVQGSQFDWSVISYLFRLVGWGVRDNERKICKAVDTNRDGLVVERVMRVGRTREYMNWLIEASSLSPVHVS
jgi:hypothetical protein